MLCLCCRSSTGKEAGMVKKAANQPTGVYELCIHYTHSTHMPIAFATHMSPRHYGLARISVVSCGSCAACRGVPMLQTSRFHARLCGRAYGVYTHRTELPETLANEGRSEPLTANVVPRKGRKIRRTSLFAEQKRRRSSSSNANSPGSSPLQRTLLLNSLIYASPCAHVYHAGQTACQCCYVTCYLHPHPR